MNLRELFEAEGRIAVVAFGRMNPPTIGHAKLVDKIKSFDGDHYVFLSQSQKPKTDPLAFADKLRYAKFFFPEITIGHPSVRTPIQMMQFLEELGYTDIIYVAGSDRVAAFDKLFNDYNGKDYNFNSIQIVSAGERDPDADGAEGMSASKMRQAAADNDLESFKQGVPRPEVADEMFAAVRAGMGIRDEVPAESLEESDRSVALDKKFDPLVARAINISGGDKDILVAEIRKLIRIDGFVEYWTNTEPDRGGWTETKFRALELLGLLDEDAIDEGWFGFGEDDPIAAPEWLDSRVKAYWEKINPVDDGSIRSMRLKTQIANLERFAQSGLTDQANKVAVEELKKYLNSNESVEESNLVLDKSRLRSHIISLIADKIAQTDDIDQLAEWLKYIVGKELKPRGTRYQITSEDVVEACKMHKKKKK